MIRFLLRRMISVAVGILTTCAAAGASTPAISLRVNPQVAIASPRLIVSIVITIDPNENNRVGSLEIIGEDYYTGSEFPVTSAKTYRFERRITDEGNYWVIAKVRRLNGDTFTARQNLMVASGEAQPSQQSKLRGS